MLQRIPWCVISHESALPGTWQRQRCGLPAQLRKVSGAGGSLRDAAGAVQGKLRLQTRLEDPTSAHCLKVVLLCAAGLGEDAVGPSRSAANEPPPDPPSVFATVGAMALGGKGLTACP